ncbi:MAG: hypothetical protein LBJ00_08530 [Planctomycetaceae bacterium]|nr:hypothetical protein [Planctomycetaceae bacterium]
MITVQGIYLHGEGLPILNKLKRNPYYPPEIIVNSLPESLHEIQVVDQPVEGNHNSSLITRQSLLTQKISPCNNYLFIPHVGSPISFATGKPLPISDMQLERYGLKTNHGINLYWQNFSSDENLCAIFIENEVDSYWTIVDLRTGSFKKIPLPLPNSELYYIRIMGISNSHPERLNLKNSYIVIKLAEKYPSPFYASIWYTDVSLAKSSSFRQLIVPTPGYFVKLLPTMYFIIGDTAEVLPFKNPKRCVLWYPNGYYINEFPVRISALCHVSNDGSTAAFLDLEGTTWPNPHKTWIRVFETITVNGKVPKKEIAPPIWLGRFRWPMDHIAFALSDDNQMIAVNIDGFVTIYELKTGKVVMTTVAKELTIPQFSHNGKFLWLYDKDKNDYIAVYDVKTGKKIFFVAHFNKNGYWAVIAADGRYDGSKETLDYIKIKPEGLPDKPENYFSPNENPRLYVDGLLATFFNAQPPDHYWFKNPQQIQQMTNQQKNLHPTSQPVLLPPAQQPLPQRIPFIPLPFPPNKPLSN